MGSLLELGGDMKGHNFASIIILFASSIKLLLSSIELGADYDKYQHPVNTDQNHLVTGCL